MNRKSPIKHIVHKHKQKGNTINPYSRGTGFHPSKISNPTIKSSEKKLMNLFNLQDKLIEHKYPVQGIWSTMIMHAGDVYRGLCKGKQNGAYINEKMNKLNRFMNDNTFPLSKSEMVEFWYYANGEYGNKYNEEKHKKPAMDKQRAQFNINLAKLTKETSEANIDPKRKRAMLFSLNMIKSLVTYYESKSPSFSPDIEWVNMKGAVEWYLDT